jgi:hypothetical protein
MGLPMTNELIEFTPLLQRAVDTLNNAKTSAEILDARNAAHTALAAAQEAEHLARTTGAAQAVITACHEAQSQALKIETQAKIRLADEYDAAQKRGEVAAKNSGRPKSIPDQNTYTTVTDIGLTSKEVYEARQMRDAEVKEPGVIAKALDADVTSGKSPKRATIAKVVQKTLKRETLDKSHPEPEKKSHRAETLPKIDTVISVILPDLEAGRPISREKLVEDLGVGERDVRDADQAGRYYLKGRKEALEDLASGKIEALSLTAQQKLEVHKRQLNQEHQRRMLALEIEKRRAEAEFKKRVDDQVRSDCDTFIIPSYTNELKQLRAALESARKGAFTNAQYRELLACLHPDRIPDDQPELKRRYTETFQRVNQLRLTMVKPEEAPLPPSAVPRSYAEMMEAKERVRAQRVAQRQNKTDTPVHRKGM